MRIRRYAARLLASSGPSSSPDVASAPWLHAAAADDDCDFCQLTRGSDPQVAPDGIKHRGHVHIAGPEPEAELLKTHDDLPPRPPAPEALIPAQGEIKNQLADRPPIPEVQGCEIDCVHSPREDAAVLEIPREDAVTLELQVAYNGKGHSAGLEPEGELLKTHDDLAPQPPAPEALIPAQGELKNLADRPPIPEVQGSEINRVHSAREDVAGQEIPREDAVSQELQVAYEGRIAGLELEGELLKTHDDLAPRPPSPEELIPAQGNLKNLAERLPTPEVQGCEIDHVHSGREDAVWLEIPREDAVILELQVAYKGHIAGLEPEGELLETHDDLAPQPPAPEELIPVQGELKNLAEQPPIPEGARHTPTLEPRSPALEELIPAQGELKNLAERPPITEGARHTPTLEPRPPVPEELIPAQGELKNLAILEVQGCEIDHVHSAREDAAGLEITREDAVSLDLQVAYKWHIAGLEPEGEVLQSDEKVDLPQQPRVPEPEDEVGSVSSTSSGPVRDKSSTADKVAPHDDTPSISCISDIVARSVGKSARTDIVCYARRRGKRKLDMVGMKTQEIKIDDGDIYDPCEEKTRLKRTAPCESAMSTAGSAEIKLSDIKRGLADNSASSKCKRRKGRFECDIDYCRMAFKKRSELSVHKKNMCTVKSCGKRFRSHKYLRRHQSIHNDDTPYKCPWEDCSMAFKWTWSLADHFQVHTGEKPYRCKTPGCSKIYKYVSDFIRHKKRCKPQVKT